MGDYDFDLDFGGPERRRYENSEEDSEEEEDYGRFRREEAPVPKERSLTRMTSTKETPRYLPTGKSSLLEKAQAMLNKAKPKAVTDVKDIMADLSSDDDDDAGSEDTGSDDALGSEDEASDTSEDELAELPEEAKPRQKEGLTATTKGALSSSRRFVRSIGDLDGPGTGGPGTSNDSIFNFARETDFTTDAVDETLERMAREDDTPSRSSSEDQMSKKGGSMTRFGSVEDASYDSDRPVSNPLAEDYSSETDGDSEIDLEKKNVMSFADLAGIIGTTKVDDSAFFKHEDEDDYEDDHHQEEEEDDDEEEAQEFQQLEAQEEEAQEDEQEEDQLEDQEEDQLEAQEEDQEGELEAQEEEHEEEDVVVVGKAPVLAESKGPSSDGKEFKRAEAKKQRAAREAARREVEVAPCKKSHHAWTLDTPFYVEFSIRLNAVPLAALDASTRDAFVEATARALGVSLKSVSLRGARESLQSEGSVLETRVAVRDSDVARALGAALARAPALFTQGNDVRFDQSDYLGAVGVSDGGPVFFYQFLEEKKAAAGPRVDRVLVDSSTGDDVDNDADARALRESGLSRSREVATQFCGNHAGVQADLEVAGLDGTAAFLPPPPTRVLPVGYRIDSAYNDPSRWDNRPSPPIIYDRRSPANQSHAETRATAVDHQEEAAAVEKTTSKDEFAFPQEMYPQGWPAYGCGYGPWFCPPPQMGTYFPMMTPDPVHYRKTQLELLADAHARIAVASRTNDENRDTAAPSSRLTQMVAAQKAYRSQLTDIRQRIMQQRFNADLVARGVSGATYPSLDTTREFLETHRPPPLPYWQAFMKVDPSLTEAEARDLAASHVASLNAKRSSSS